MSKELLLAAMEAIFESTNCLHILLSNTNFCLGCYDRPKIVNEHSIAPFYAGAGEWIFFYEGIPVEIQEKRLGRQFFIDLCTGDLFFLVDGVEHKMPIEEWCDKVRL